MTRPAATRDYTSPSGSHRRRNDHGGEERELTVPIETTVTKATGEEEKAIVQEEATGEPIETTVTKATGEEKKTIVQEKATGELIFTIASFQIAHAAMGVYGELMVTNNLGKKFRMAIISSIPGAVCEIFRETIGIFSSDWHQMSTCDLLCKRHAFNAPAVLASKEKSNTIHFLGPLSNEAPCLLSVTAQLEELKLAGPTILLGPATEEKNDFVSFEIISIMGPDEDSELLTKEGQISPAPQKQSPHSTSNDSPPGFAGSPHYARGLIRHSTRLSSKNKGVYVCPEERVRLVSKPYSVSFTHPKKAKEAQPFTD